jgi:hypothetical protein
LVLQCLANEPKKRPQSVRELRAGLLATPRAADWTLEERARWWEKYHQLPPEQRAAKGASTPLPTVRIDFAERISPE